LDKTAHRLHRRRIDALSCRTEAVNLHANPRTTIRRRTPNIESIGPAYARVAELLSETAGVDIARLKRSTVLRRVLRRMHRIGLDDLLDYAGLLAREPSEVATLVRELLLPQTAIFRDPEVYVGLLAQLAPLLRASQRPQLWVPVCGSGEEVYALAMLAAEVLGNDAGPFLVLGTDVDSDALEQARAGVFSREAALRVPPRLRERYLVAADDGYRVSQQLVHQCLFLRHDVLGPPPLPDVDLICCRDLLRYLDLSAQRHLLENLHAALRPGGLLLLGNGEGALLQEDLFLLPARSPCLHVRAAATPVAARAAPPTLTGGRLGGFFRAAFELSALPMAMLGGDYRILSVNPSLARLLRMSPQELAGRSLIDLMAEVDRERVQDGLNDLEEDGRRELDAHAMREGEELPLRLCLTRPAGEVPGFIAEFHYVTSEESLRRALAGLNNRIALAQSMMREGIVVTDADGAILEFNERAERLTGWSRAEACGQRHDRVLRLLGATGAPERNPLWSCLRDPRNTEPQLSERILLARDGRRLNLRCAVAPIVAEDGQGDGAMLLFEDTTQMSLLSEELAYRTSHDPITGLLNRDEFERRVNGALLEARRSGAQHLLCYLDLDQFKIVNDVHGHFAGDEMLRLMAGVFRACLRPEDALARLGGDEFGILLRDCSVEQGQPLLDALLDGARRNRFIWEGHSFTTTTSMGVVLINGYTVSTARALSQADAACFAAKDGGRDRIRIADADDESLRRHTQMSLVSKISQALDHNHFCLHYEDVVRTSAPQEIVYRELLVRMRTPGGEMQPPAEFIAAAERYYLMNALDRWVVQAALSGIAQRSADGIIYGINISGLSLNDEKFLNYVVSRFETFGVAPEQVCFEITETAAISHLTEARRFIERLSDIGCRFALDDFGSGMASFSYLRNLPVHFIKIEGSFVRSMLANRLDRGMVEAINRIGHDMGLKTIAEHVEDVSLIEPLRAMGVDWVQGHAIARSRPFEDLIRS
jgi:diguanylate cyclase (GGDEF)-like protein/PAS domain S-box-containing protein